MRYFELKLIALLVFIGLSSCKQGPEEKAINNFFASKSLIKLSSYEKWKTIRCKDSLEDILEDIRLDLVSKFAIDKDLASVPSKEKIKDSLTLAYFNQGLYDSLHQYKNDLKQIKTYKMHPDSILAYKYVCKVIEQDLIDGTKRTSGIFLIFLSPSKEKIIYSKRAEGISFTFYNTHNPPVERD